MMINDLISREQLVDHIHACMENDRLMKTATKEEILNMVANVPFVDAMEVKRGKWIKVGDYTCRCSVCNEVSCCMGSYCPDCGAMMEGEETEDEEK